MEKKVLVIGLDCAPGEIVFDRRKELPVLGELVDNSVYGNLRSSDPPITIPAWMVMCTGKDPGRLGLYGFRHRKGLSSSTITSNDPESHGRYRAKPMKSRLWNNLMTAL